MTLQEKAAITSCGTEFAKKCFGEIRFNPPSPGTEAHVGRYLIIAMALLAPGYFAVDRVDRAIACLARSNAELMKANAQLSTANRQIAVMQEKLADTCRKLDQTNENIVLTNHKFDETNTRFVALDQVFQKIALFRK